MRIILFICRMLAHRLIILFQNFECLSIKNDRIAKTCNILCCLMNIMNVIEGSLCFTVFYYSQKIVRDILIIVVYWYIVLDKISVKKIEKESAHNRVNEYGLDK